MARRMTTTTPMIMKMLLLPFENMELFAAGFSGSVYFGFILFQDSSSRSNMPPQFGHLGSTPSFHTTLAFAPLLF